MSSDTIEPTPQYGTITLVCGTTFLDDEEGRAAMRTHLTDCPETAAIKPPPPAPVSVPNMGGLTLPELAALVQAQAVEIANLRTGVVTPLSSTIGDSAEDVDDPTAVQGG